MRMKADIYKAGGILIKNRRLLVERSRKREFFIAPGGQIEKGETPQRALIRELQEEFGLTVAENDLEEFGTFYASAAERAGKVIQMNVFIVNKWDGSPAARNEVEELRWVSFEESQQIKLGSIFEHDVLPRLKKLKLIS